MAWVITMISCMMITNDLFLIVRLHYQGINTASLAGYFLI